MVVGAQVEGASIMTLAPDLFACLQSALLDDQISRAAVLQVKNLCSIREPRHKSFIATRKNL